MAKLATPGVVSLQGVSAALELPPNGRASIPCCPKGGHLSAPRCLSEAQAQLDGDIPPFY
jgi:hypothetical protein